MNTSLIDLDRLPQGYAESLRVVMAAPADRPFVIAQLGQSLDGRIALMSGESRWINNGSALDHLHRLRAVVDGVVVGVGTAIADDPSLNVRRVKGRHPARVVIDPKGRLGAGAKMFNGDGVERISITSDGARVPAGVERIVIGARGQDQEMAPRAIVDALYGRGLRRLLIEGGAWTVSSFIDAGVVDRLHVLVAPCLLGSGKSGLNLAPLERLADARRPRVEVHVLEGGDVLFDCDLRT